MFFPFLIFAEPADIFRRVEEGRPWLTPLSYCTLGMFAITWLGGCWENLSDGLRWWSLLGPAVFSPLAVGIACLGSTLVLYLGQQIVIERSFGGLTYRSLFSLNAHGALILVLGEVVNFLLVHSRLLQDFDVSLSNRFPLGMDLLLLGVKEPNIYLNIILHSISIFSIWYLVVIARGIHHLSGVSAVRVALIVGGLWLTTVVFALTAVSVLGGGTIIRIIL
jgi:hypothetical protein